MPDKKEQPNLIYQLYSDNEPVTDLLQRAETILRDVTAKKVPAADLETFLEQNDSDSFLSTENDTLGRRTPLAVLRAKIEEEKQADSLPNRRLATSHPRKDRNLRSRSVPRLPGTNLPGRFSIVREKSDLAYLSDSTTIIHLSHQEAINKTTLRNILNNCPNLKTVQMPRSFERLITPGYKQLLDERGIELRYDRIRDEDHYDDVLTTDSYFTKRGNFNQLLSTTKGKQIFQQMIKYELEEAELAKIYFGVERVSMAQIGRKMGLTQHQVQRKIEYFTNWFNLDSKDWQENATNQKLIRRLRRFQRAEESEKEREDLRQGYSVDRDSPPEKLKLSRWPMWQKIIRWQKENPDKYAQLVSTTPRPFVALVEYFQLDEGTTGELKTAAEKLGVSSSERARQLKNLALNLMGLIEDNN